MKNFINVSLSFFVLVFLTSCELDTSGSSRSKFSEDTGSYFSNDSRAKTFAEKMADKVRQIENRDGGSIFIESLKTDKRTNTFDDLAKQIEKSDAESNGMTSKLLEGIMDFTEKELGVDLETEMSDYFETMNEGTRELETTMTDLWKEMEKHGYDKSIERVLEGEFSYEKVIDEMLKHAEQGEVSKKEEEIYKDLSKVLDGDQAAADRYSEMLIKEIGKVFEKEGINMDDYYNSKR